MAVSGAYRTLPKHTFSARVQPWLDIGLKWRARIVHHDRHLVMRAVGDVIARTFDQPTNCSRGAGAAAPDHASLPSATRPRLELVWDVHDRPSRPLQILSSPRRRAPEAFHRTGAGRAESVPTDLAFFPGMGLDAALSASRSRSICCASRKSAPCCERNCEDAEHDGVTTLGSSPRSLHRGASIPASWTPRSGARPGERDHSLRAVG